MGVRFLFITSPLIGEAKYCDDHVCLSVCLYLSDSKNISETTPPIFTNFFVLATYGRGSVVLCWHCNTLCTFGLLMTENLHAHNGQYLLPRCQWQQPASMKVQPACRPVASAARPEGRGWICVPCLSCLVCDTGTRTIFPVPTGMSSENGYVMGIKTQNHTS